MADWGGGPRPPSKYATVPRRGDMYVTPINLIIGMVRSSMPNFTFIGAEIWEHSPKTVRICNFSHNLPLGRLVCTIFTKLSKFEILRTNLL